MRALLRRLWERLTGSQELTADDLVMAELLTRCLQSKKMVIATMDDEGNLTWREEEIPDADPRGIAAPMRRGDR